MKIALDYYYSKEGFVDSMEEVYEVAPKLAFNIARSLMFCFDHEYCDYVMEELAVTAHLIDGMALTAEVFESKDLHDSLCYLFSCLSLAEPCEDTSLTEDVFTLTVDDVRPWIRRGC